LSQGKMTIGGVKLDLKKIKVPVYNLATREDHIAPAKSVLEGSQYFGGPVRYVLAGSGHITGVVNPPGKIKYQYWTSEKKLGRELDKWMAGAKEHAGSWWPDWIEWIKTHDQKTAPARKVGSAKYKPIEDAPGSYVKVKS
jgi:polyhydroxyalkanoate synthase